MYLNDPRMLIVKFLQGGVHEVATTGVKSVLFEKVTTLGLRHAIGSVRSKTFHGNAGQKEADSAFKHGAARPLETDWPTLVIECGVSETVPLLGVDSRWWLDNSL
ncbi:hypothetical protein HOY82DRAFT_490932 [Tuber indicum]|nr:hypothetical protein HOY82DRAFT_490932 [Tuber indicum]